MAETTVKAKYKFSKDYNPIYVNGAYGGINPRGEIIVNFYLERSPLPYEETMSVNEKGEIMPGTVVSPEDFATNIIRYVSTGIVLNLQSAKNLHEWLGQHIKLLEGLKSEGEPS